MAVMKLLLGAGLSPAQADPLCTAHAISRECLGKLDVFYLDIPYLQFVLKCQLISGTFCLSTRKQDAAG